MEDRRHHHKEVSVCFFSWFEKKKKLGKDLSGEDDDLMSWWLFMLLKDQYHEVAISFLSGRFAPSAKNLWLSSLYIKEEFSSNTAASSLFWFRMKGKKEKHIACWWLCIQCWMKLEKRRRKATDKERHVSHEGRKTRSISSTFLFFLHLWCSVWFMPLTRTSFCFKTPDCRLWDINGDEPTTRIGWLQYSFANENLACKPTGDEPCKRFFSVNCMKNRSFDWTTDEWYIQLLFF